MKTLNLGLLGLGTVGGGVAKIVGNNGYDIDIRSGVNIRIKKALVRESDKEKACAEFEKTFVDTITTDVDDVLNDSDIDIVVEVMGGVDTARQFVTRALNSGKHVVTANKDLLAVHGAELFALAAEKGLDLGFEASVGGGIPIIAAMQQNLTANRIESVLGIINGTTNYILSEMTSQRRDFHDVLTEAQRLGFAEADPTSDVGGLDAARKLAILSSLAFNCPVALDDVYVEGITKITPEDIAYASELNCVIKLLAIASRSCPADGRPEGVAVKVHPTLIPMSHPLASVDGVFNAVYIVGDAVGETMFYGRGAGSMPTGSAIVADIVQIARRMATSSTGKLFPQYYHDTPVLPLDQQKTGFYIRLKVMDEPRVFANLALFFAEADISFASIIQKPRHNNRAEVVFITHPCLEAQMRKALTALESYPKLEKVYNLIRIENGEK
ncbi:MAG: homoserine dehydrogenase [Peptococcaceae bacterium]|nr:homoserine dehydrogenase [Peptococcaceae bacterium]